MSNQIVEGEDTVVSFSKDRTSRKIAALIQDNVGLDKESFLEDLAEELGVEVEELPRVDATVVVSFGNSKITVPAFTVEEKDEDDEDE